MTLLIANTFISISATYSSDDVIVIKHITSASSFVMICQIDFFSNILAKPNVTYNTISLSWDPAPRRSLR